MKKKIILAVTAAALAVSMAVCAMAEYVPCADGNEAHDFGEWTLKETFDDGNTLSERVCSKCGYVEKGYGRVDDPDGSHMAVTLSLDLDTVPVAAANPSTGAAA